MYDPEWSEDIACSLPVTRKEHFWRQGLIPFFEHLGPEGWLRGRQARAGGTADQDDFGLLLNYGEECIGAVGIRPADGQRPDVPSEDDDPVDRAATGPGRTLSGVQKKWLVYHDETGFRPATNLSDPATHIAKFNRDERSTIVQNENLSLCLGREVLGEGAITAARIAPVIGAKGIALVVERFDRLDGEQLRLEDFAQILEKPRGREFDGKYHSSYEEAASVIRNFSARAVIDLDRFFRLVVFNLVIGNADAHLKNFSLLERPEGLRLSPAYDLVNTLCYPELDDETALEIAGKKHNLTSIDRKLVETLGLEIGLTPRAVERALAELAARLDDPRTLQFGPQIQPDDLRERYRTIVSANTGRLFA